MRINNTELSFKIFFTILTFVLLICTVLIIMSEDLTGITLQYILVNCYFLLVNLAEIAFTVYSWGYNIIDENGITRCFLFFKKQYSWNDLQFISKSRAYGKNWSIIEKIIVSVKIPKDDFKKKYIYRLFSKKCFCMPYSKALESYIIAKAPIECYTYSYIVDDTTDEKYSKYIT
ncbi:MAG: hypothetical protein UHK60_01110 [Acutalibacteraceae bacterium]|nr:hypothetical protein [Acutalibacteraceae bacterium]